MKTNGGVQHMADLRLICVETVQKLCHARFRSIIMPADDTSASQNAIGQFGIVCNARSRVITVDKNKIGSA